MQISEREPPGPPLPAHGWASLANGTR